MRITSATPIDQPASSGIARMLEQLNVLLSRFPASIVQLILRFALAVPFWKSGLTKWDGWFTLSDGAIYVFTEEFKLHLFNQLIAYPFPKVMAFASGTAEIVLPVLLVLGLATRFAAFGILLMTLLIQLTIPDAWANFHLPWAAMAMALMVHGPGRASLDHLLAPIRPVRNAG